MPINFRCLHGMLQPSQHVTAVKVYSTVSYGINFYLLAAFLNYIPCFLLCIFGNLELCFNLNLFVLPA